MTSHQSDAFAFVYLDLPCAVIEPRQSPTPFRVRHLTNVARSTDAAKANAKAKDEASGEELAGCHGRGLDASTDYNYSGACKHAPDTQISKTTTQEGEDVVHSSSEIVINRAGAENSRDSSNVVESWHLLIPSWRS